MIETGQGPILGGRYVLLECVGSGGSAEVHRARDRLLEREVALKLLRVEQAMDPGCVERFRREARSAASLSHPNIVQIYELGLLEEGHPFVAMEYVRGGTLKRRLRDSGPLDPVAAAEKAGQIARALRAAHDQGIVHCDIKPQNLLLTDSGAVKVADFGIACEASSGPRSGDILGTARYMSPEQAADEAVGPGSDLYSLGAVLYEMLTGAPPFSGHSQASIALKRAEETPRPPRDLDPSIPEAISAVTLRLLAKSPADRPASAAALLEELEAAIEASSQRPETTPEHSRVYRAGSWLSFIFEERRRSFSRASAAQITRSDQLKPNAGRGNRRRRRRGASLAAVSVIILLAAAGWGLYGGDPRTVYEEGARQSITGSPGAQASPAGVRAERVVVHTAEAENISDNSTYLDLPETNGEPGAVVSVTQSWNPGSQTGTYNDHPVGVWYDADRERWAVFNQDREAMPEGASFNVVVWSEPERQS